MTERNVRYRLIHCCWALGKPHGSRPKSTQSPPLPLGGQSSPAEPRGPHASLSPPSLWRGGGHPQGRKWPAEPQQRPVLPTPHLLLQSFPFLRQKADFREHGPIPTRALQKLWCWFWKTSRTAPFTTRAQGTLRLLPFSSFRSRQLSRRPRRFPGH